MKHLLLKIKRLPLSSGCYIFKNVRGEIIYIGKSKALRNRVKQYFQNIDSKEGKYIRLVKEIHDVDIMLTDSETDALILECKLIKMHKPKYNSQLKKPKIYPYIKINTKADFPPLSITKKIENDGCEYFGCFYGEDDALQTLALISNIWKTPLCCKNNFDGQQRACLNYHLKKCCAPCEGLISSSQYTKKIKEIIKCMKGNSQSIMRRLNKEMSMAAKELDFEKAACLRDSLKGLERLQQKHKKLNTVLEDKDIFLFFRAFNEDCFSIFFIRNGLTLAGVRFNSICEINKEHLSSFIQDIRNEKFEPEDSKFLTTCLLEIHADKLYVPIKNINSEKTIEILEKEFFDFIPAAECIISTNH